MQRAEGMCLKATASIPEIRMPKPRVGSVNTCTPQGHWWWSVRYQRRLRLNKSARKGRPPNRPVPDRQVVLNGFDTSPEWVSHFACNRAKCELPSRMEIQKATQASAFIENFMGQMVQGRSCSEGMKENGCQGDASTRVRSSRRHQHVRSTGSTIWPNAR